MDTECCLEDLPVAMNNKDKRWERVGEISASHMTWWCIYINFHIDICVCVYIYIYIYTIYPTPPLGQDMTQGQMDTHPETTICLIKIYKSKFVYTYTDLLKNGLMSRGFANGLGDLGSIQGRVIPKTQKMALDAALLNTKVRIKGKVKQSREWNSAFPYTSV